MKNKVKDWVEHEFAWTLQHGGNMRSCLDRCYGAVMFVLSCEDDEKLGKWWADEMHPIFMETILGGK